MIRKFIIAIALTTALGMLVGCGDTAKDKVAKNSPKKQKEDDHSGWWCFEHGIPEGDCSLCLSPDVVKKRFKDTGDWCELHDRAKSQCFKCDPSLYEKVFEPKYVARYGKKPERPDEDQFKK